MRAQGTLQQFRRRDLYEIRPTALFLDATFISVRPDGPKSVQVASDSPKRASGALAVSLGMRESFEDSQSLGRDLISRELGAPMLIVADGAPGLIKAIEQCWPASDRQRCCVHRARNLYAKVPDRERERVKHAYWQALDDAISETDAKRRLQELVDELTRPASRPPPAASPMTSTPSLCTCATQSGTDEGSARRICSSAHSARSSGAPRSSASPADELLTLVWAVLDLLITHQTNGINFNALDRQRLKRARYHGTARPSPRDHRRLNSSLVLGSSTSSLAEATGLPNRLGVAAVGAGRKPGLARSVGISVALGDSSSPALALLLDRSGCLAAA